jgi:transcription-repair coupling factor (superfamily II helicase)
MSGSPSNAPDALEAEGSSGSLRPLLEVAFDEARISAVARELREGNEEGGPVDVAVSSPARPFLIAALSEAASAVDPTLVVTADDRSARQTAESLGAFLDASRIHLYPSRGVGFRSHLAPPPHLAGLRVSALSSMAREEGWEPGLAPIVIASAVALAESVPEASLRPQAVRVSVGSEADLELLSVELTDAGYRRVDQVTERGEFAIRGGICDVFGATDSRAARIELFGDEVEEIRWFSTFTQRSLGETESIELAPASELVSEPRAVSLPEEGGDPAAPLELAELIPLDRFVSPLDLIPRSTRLVVVSEEEIWRSLRDLSEDVEAALGKEGAAELYVEIRDDVSSRASLTLGPPGEDPDWAVRAQRADFASRTPAEAEAELEKLARSGYRVVVTFPGKGEAERTRYAFARLDPPLLGDSDPPASGEVTFAVASLSEGFVSPDLKLCVAPWSSLVARRSPDREGQGSGAARLANAIELRVGDFVVHADHGIARFAGFETKTVAGVTRDYLELEYEGEDRVFSPTDQLARISRYVGAEGAEPKLSALGGKRWQTLKSKARHAAQQMAGELLNLYAERRARPGHAFPPDGEWQLAFERAFPFRETADQLEAIDAVKADMETARPMDRLICGDVGYGKTEVALRAAFKAAADGKQVLMLVPTTILAQQHYATFSERLLDHPFRVEAVSRLRSAAETREVIADFSDGKVDILIGTHRLLSKDVRAKDLGLVIVDEEQRFGVKQKELLQRMKLRVDVLSMSATPIPRTLQMSLAGMRDISVIETPPEGRRPVRTYVGPDDEDLVRRALEREVERGGQTFFLHNRIDSLHDTAERLRMLCPQAKFVEAHGQMADAELEKAMLAFVKGDADCLVTTTIIESGLDIPNANTLIVDRADRLGLSQAYQIRGRVGRSRERAFAYMLYPSTEALTADAAARLATLADNTELGSGFRVAMRDLEIRGAGNLLGTEQSGHVAAVGFELYCQMIEEATEEMKASLDSGDESADGESRPPIRMEIDADAYVPASYVPFEAAKIDLHRRIAAAREPGEIRALRSEIEDRFGPPPQPVENLLALGLARLRLDRAGASIVEVKAGKLRIEPLDISSDEAAAVRDQIDGALYDWKAHRLEVLVPDEVPDAALTVLAAVADFVASSRTTAAE